MRPQVKALVQRLQSVGVTTLGEPQAAYALRSIYANGDADKAFEFLVLLEESAGGIIRDYDRNVKLLGAVNRDSVTCYLDALLFAMFARLEGFEPILCNTFEDEPRKRLSILLRLWVNMLRSGKLITTDITQHLQEAIAACGWDEAAKLRQQDASEAFTFITGTLMLPLLTLKMDIFHTGKEEAADDHKFVNERLLEVAIPTDLEENKVITLEDCLETYFNNRIDVRRHLERRQTQTSVRSADSSKALGYHHEKVEAVELGSRPSSPSSPLSQTPTNASPLRPAISRHRAPSIIRDRVVEEANSSERAGPRRKSSIRKEVMMPAWQFFSLIPWYTDNSPTNDAQVAAHLASKRPLLGLCLKRYFMQPNGRPTRLNTYVDIPLEIGLPHFIQDDRMDEDAPLFGNFKLCLQSVVCHRGSSLDSGHYVSLVRGEAPNAEELSKDSLSLECPEERWMRFDDLARERVKFIDIKKALREETPYLLFYQVQPIEEETDDTPPYDHEHDRPPSYSEHGHSHDYYDSYNHHSTDRHNQSQNRDWGTGSLTLSDVREGVTEDYQSRNPSFELTNYDADPRGRTSWSSDRRRSIQFDQSSLQVPSGAITPSEETPGDASVPSRSGSKTLKSPSKSRPPSQSGERTFAGTISRLSARLSRDKLATAEPNGEATVEDGNGGPPGSVGSSFRSDISQALEKDKDKDKEKGKQRKKEKRLRSRTRLPKERPERECSIM
ncbi:cysteine proteinase [Xylona heveae TC161]|uniref:ubiquitinyl hydrolase 1 n=1 Tax=Xylona heveae (strain CBS 132557 / TC161) TaxID=1328760 RepID=A0A165GSF8_XYLHT|nr:cysteine proteinase [Xylona heveae TC161]KZF22536.1 cysteine proteinase [Xylona heveae TC161]